MDIKIKLFIGSLYSETQTSLEEEVNAFIKGVMHRNTTMAVEGNTIIIMVEYK